MQWVSPTSSDQRGEVTLLATHSAVDGGSPMSDAPVSCGVKDRVWPGVIGLQGEKSACLPKWYVLVVGRGWRERSQRSQTLILLCPIALRDLVNSFSSLGLSFCICNGVRYGPAILPLVGASWACLCLDSSLARCSVSALFQPGTMGQTGRVTYRPQTQSLRAPPWTIFSPRRWSQKRIFHS